MTTNDEWPVPWWVALPLGIVCVCAIFGSLMFAGHIFRYLGVWP